MALLMGSYLLPIGRTFSSQVWDSYKRFSHCSQFPTSFLMFLDLSDSPDELLNMEFTLGFKQWGEGNFSWNSFFLLIHKLRYRPLPPLGLTHLHPCGGAEFSAGKHERARTFHWEWNNSVIVPSWIPGTTLQTKQFSSNMKQPVPTIR